MSKRVNKLTSLAAYAKHRGVSRAPVTKAVQEGRLDRCLVDRLGRRCAARRARSTVSPGSIANAKRRGAGRPLRSRCSSSAHGSARRWSG